MTIDHINKIEELLNRLAGLGFEFECDGLHIKVVDTQEFDQGFGFEDERQMLAWLEGVIVGIVFGIKDKK